MRILISDDDPVYRKLVADLLSQWGFEPVVTANGREGLEVMQGPEAPRLLILDWMMPEMDGFELARAVRAREQGPAPYILLITGSANKEEVMKVMVCGADDYLIKPFDPVDLKIHLRTATRIVHLEDELLSRRQAPQPQPAQAAS